MDPLGVSVTAETINKLSISQASRPEVAPQLPAKDVPSPLHDSSPQRVDYALPPSATFPVSPDRPLTRQEAPITPRSPFSTDSIPSSFSQRRPYEEGSAQRQPQASTSAPLAAPSQPSVQQQRDPFVKIRILGMDRAKKDVWIKLDASTNLSTFHSGIIKAFSRSFAEFVALHTALAANHPQVIVPALPIPATSASTEEEEDRLLKIQFQKWADRITRNPDLAKDEELRSFLEANFGYQPVTVKRRLKSSTSFTDKLSLRSRGHDPDDPLGAIKAEMGRIETHMSEVAKAIDKEGRNRKVLAGALFDLSEQCNAYSTSESSHLMTGAFRRVGEGARKLADLNNGLATAECVTLADALMYEAAEAKEAKDTLSQREGLVEEHRSATKSAINKKRQIEKLKSSSSIFRDKVDEALDEFDDAEKLQASLTQKLNAISQRLAPSLTSHTRQIHEDLFAALSTHSRAGLAYERQVLKDLETLRKEIKAIPPINTHPSSTASKAYYVHPTDSTPSSAPIGRTPSINSAPTLATTHSRTSSLTSASAAPPVHNEEGRRAASSYHSSDRMAASLYQPAPTASASNSPISKSMILGPPPPDLIASQKLAQSLADERRAVNARAAASKLANMF